MNWSLDEVIRATGARLEAPWTGPRNFSGVYTDSRDAVPGALFVPLAGERFDGHHFVAKALKTGAGAALWALPDIPDTMAPEIVSRLIRVDSGLEAYQALGQANLQRLGLPVVAITGSVGKTTTKDLLRCLLGVKYKVHCTSKNFNNEVGVPKTLLELSENDNIAVIELGMRGSGQIKALASRLKPSVGVITAIGESHLELLGSRENIAKAKAELLECMDEKSLAVLPFDSAYLDLLLSRLRGRQCTFSVISSSRRTGPTQPDWSLEGLRGYTLVSTSSKEPFNVSLGPQHLKLVRELKVCHGEHSWNLSFPLPGLHNVSNLLASLAVLEEFDISPRQLQEALLGFKPTGQRTEMDYLACGAYLIDDSYNAAPTSVRSGIDVLCLLNSLAPGSRRKIAVLGDMLELGCMQEQMHWEIGQYCVKQKIDILITVGEISKNTASGAKKAGLEHVYSVEDREQAWYRVRELVEPGDCLLVKGSHSIGLDLVAERLRALSVSSL